MSPSQTLGSLNGHDVGISQLIRPRARALSYQLIEGPDGGIDYTFSSIALQPAFLTGDMPLPIITAVERPPDDREQLLRKPPKDGNLDAVSLPRMLTCQKRLTLLRLNSTPGRLGHSIRRRTGSPLCHIWDPRFWPGLCPTTHLV